MKSNIDQLESTGSRPPDESASTLGLPLELARPHPAEVLNNDEAYVIAAAVQEQLDAGGCYYVGGDKQNALYPSPDLFLISEAERHAIEDLGRHTFELVATTSNLYVAAITGQIEGMDWLVEAIEGPLTDHQRAVQQAVAVHDAGRLPMFARADLTSINPIDGGVQCETQFRIGCLGLETAFQRATREVIPLELGANISAQLIPEVMAEAIREVTDVEVPTAVLIAPEAYIDEQQYLADELLAIGINALVLPKSQLERFTFDGSRLLIQLANGQQVPVDFVYRREVNAAMLAESEAGMALVNAVLADGVIVEPLLSMLFDTKVPLAVAHDPRAAAYVSGTARSAAPMTALMPPDLTTLLYYDGRETTLQEILDIGNLRRRFVIKYAGPNIQYGMGGRAVYSLHGQSHPLAHKLLEYGMSQVREGNAWIIQELDRTRYPARWLERDGQLHSSEKTAVRFMAHYRRHADGAIELFEGMGTNRGDGHWKAAGSSESHVRMMRVQHGS